MFGEGIPLWGSVPACLEFLFPVEGEKYAKATILRNPRSSDVSLFNKKLSGFGFFPLSALFSLT